MCVINIRAIGGYKGVTLHITFTNIILFLSYL